MTGIVGGDVCATMPNIACSDESQGFTLEVDAVLKLFEKDLVNVWPVVEVLGNLEPHIRPVFDLIDECCKVTLKKSLNSAGKQGLTLSFFDDSYMHRYLLHGDICYIMIWRCAPPWD